MTPIPPGSNFLSKKFGKILPQGFWILSARVMVKSTLTPTANPLKSLTPHSCPAWTTP